MTTTTTPDDAPLQLPPTPEAVKSELYALRRNEGVTPRKIADSGDNLKRLPISQDEHHRTGAVEGRLPVATIDALKCVVNSYKWQHIKPGEVQNVSWIILWNELNLDQSLGFHLDGRQKKAHMEMGSTGPKDYKNRSDAVYTLFADQIAMLRESLCRPRDEWADREASEIRARTDDEIVALIRSVLLQLGPDAYSNIKRTISVLSGLMPNLSKSVKESTIWPHIDGALVFDALRQLGARFYDDIAQRYLASIDSEMLLLPWELLSRFILQSEWPSERDYAVSSKDADTSIEYDKWPLPISKDFQAFFNSEDQLFFSHKDEQETDEFHHALYLSMTLFAQILARLDRLGRWIIPEPIQKDGKSITSMFWRQAPSKKNFDIADIWIEPITRPDKDKDEE
ncbi:hypothetical protein MSAS_23930 [Mycobacterium saskatchewanense]|uniref:Uncharacterized protein n=1 Tax=Mycobacterium saskatchewanense TaxID=220927 RepID=A0AAJ3NP82_9MYCO|nr:hypothetical protein [Mycobacterium saskatchewanense]ORW70367.1 hypothetical protein AWC23_17085 [Mycobacterium saskatchewanense]BBX63219.1 hypothetical protein MSAS_23930 [Mycobacterium saskatchewanense]